MTNKLILRHVGVPVRPRRPLSRRAILEELQNVYAGIKDMKSYRRPLADLIWKALIRLKSYGGEQSDDANVIWKMLGEEIVLRSSAQNEGDADSATQVASFLEFIHGVAVNGDQNEENDTPSSDTQSSLAPSTIVSPILPRAQADNLASPQTERDLSRSSVMSILSSLASGGSSRSQSQPEAQEEEEEEEVKELPDPHTESIVIPREVSAVSAHRSLQPTYFHSLCLASHKHRSLLVCLRPASQHRLPSKIGQSPNYRLQFLVRLRVYRDHRLYFVTAGYDPNGMVSYNLAELAANQSVKERC